MKRGEFLSQLTRAWLLRDLPWEMEIAAGASPGFHLLALH